MDTKMKTKTKRLIWSNIHDKSVSGNYLCSIGQQWIARFFDKSINDFRILGCCSTLGQCKKICQNHCNQK